MPHKEIPKVSSRSYNRFLIVRIFSGMSRAHVKTYARAQHGKVVIMKKGRDDMVFRERDKKAIFL